MSAWWEVRRSGGRGEAALVGVLSLVFIAITTGGARIALTDVDAAWLFVASIVLPAPGAFLLARAVVRSTIGLVRPERSGDGWSDLVAGSAVAAIGVSLALLAAMLVRPS